jgi:flagellin
MRINHNIASLNTYRQLTANSASSGKNLEKLSSGLRINRAGDDAAGLAISEKMRAQIRGLDQAQRNAQDGISLIQTAEGGLNETHSILQRVRELATQAANGTSTEADKKNIQEEVNQLIGELDRIANDTEYNTQKILNGDLSKTSKYATFANGATSAGITQVTSAATAIAGQTTVTLDNGGAVAAATEAIWQTGVGLEDAGQALGTAASSTTLLTNLKVAGGPNLGLQVGDEITISGIVGGEVKNATFVVQADSTLDDFMSTVKNTLGAKTVAIDTAGGTAADTSAEGLDAVATTAKALVITGQAGANNDISSLSITAKSKDGIQRTTFDQNLNNGANGGLQQVQVAANAGDFVAKIDVPGTTPAGDSRVAVRANSTIKTSNLEITFGTNLNANGTATVTVGSRDNSASIHIGANEGQTLSIGINAMDSIALGLQKDGVILSVMTEGAAEKAITITNDAISKVSTERAKLGALQNRLEHTISNLGTSSENMTSAESRIRDVDMAKEMMEFTKNNILSQAAQAMLAQANQQPQGVLQLLR